MFTTAIVRIPGNNFSYGISSSGLGKPDLKKALSQHDSYCEILRRCGLEIIILPPDLNFPDSTFVEDTAIVTDSFAIITRPGDRRRLGEEVQIEKTLSDFRKIEKIIPPGNVDGGDILQADNHFFIGLSERTNAEGAFQLQSIFEKYGYSSSTVPVGDILHLKSGVNYLGDNTLILKEDLLHVPEFHSYKKVTVIDRENYAANVVLVNEHLLIPEGFPDTKEKLVSGGFCLLEINVSEFRKMDGGLSCLSIRF